MLRFPQRARLSWKEGSMSLDYQNWGGALWDRPGLATPMLDPTSSSTQSVACHMVYQISIVYI